MSKRIFLYVYGDDYSSLTFKDEFDPQEVYKGMVKDNVKYTELEHPDTDIEIEVLEFGDIDDRFIEFVFDNLVDSDDAKSANIFEVKEV